MNELSEEERTTLIEKVRGESKYKYLFLSDDEALNVALSKKKKTRAADTPTDTKEDCEDVPEIGFTQVILPKRMPTKKALSLIQKYGGYLLLFKGAYDYWVAHPKGIVIRRGERFLINGTELIYDGAYDYWAAHPKGIAIQIGDEIRLYSYP